MKLGSNQPYRITVHTPATEENSHQPSGMLILIAVVAISATGMTVILYSLIIYILTVLNGSR